MSNLLKELTPLLIVAAMSRSLAFYRDQLGFRITQDWSPDGRLAWCRLERDGVALMLQQACDEDGPAAGRGWGVMFYFSCADASAEYERLQASGVNVAPPEVAFYGMNQLVVTDPDGYELCFQNPVAV
ncbi:VOC family protein [Planctellipticum variicoloris]|uniref:VOC family protein n=1 Tax=Planctellipticum variicoloris TaxID=3064265 RepID=UPI003013A90B|nr:VOC family protein [Planctomycetaceae bacterium SH412]